MEQNIYFKNEEDLKTKVCELIDNWVEFTVKGYCITIKRKENIHVLYKCKSGIKEKKFYVEGNTLYDKIKNLYANVIFEKEFGEIGTLLCVGTIEENK
nr:MAG TPA: hypothetical protein [Microviridae sp.]